MDITVVIPTFNRSEKLDKCLQHLEKQTFAKEQFHILVVDDGSSDNTKNIVTKWQKTLPNLKYLKQKNQGQGVARNNAIKKVKTPITLLIGDDIYLPKSALFTHFRFHQKYDQLNQVALGDIDWHPDLKIGQFQEWLTNEHAHFRFLKGPQFDFPSLANQQPSFHYFYTSHLSLKTKLLKKEPFDPWFSGYGWEDIELAYRLNKKYQLQISYLPEITALHDHQINPASFATRMKGIGYNAFKFNHRHPDANIVPKATKSIISQMIGSKPICKITQALAQKSNKYKILHYYSLGKKYFWEGYTAAKQKYATIT